MPCMCMNHVTYMYESWHIYAWVMSHICHVSYMYESICDTTPLTCASRPAGICVTYVCMSWVMACIYMTHDAYIYVWHESVRGWWRGVPRLPIRAYIHDSYIYMTWLTHVYMTWHTHTCDTSWHTHRCDTSYTSYIHTSHIHVTRPMIHRYMSHERVGG